MYMCMVCVCMCVLCVHVCFIRTLLCVPASLLVEVWGKGEEVDDCTSCV